MAAEKRDISVVLGQMLEGLNQSSACASGLIHNRQDSRWFHIRDIIEAARAMIVAECVDPMMANKGPQNGN